jgi:hypothetical protein
MFCEGVDDRAEFLLRQIGLEGVDPEGAGFDIVLLAGDDMVRGDVIRAVRVFLIEDDMAVAAPEAVGVPVVRAAQRKPEQEPVPSAPAATPREERMAVEKLVADGDVLLWVDDRRGSAERLIYQRDPELIRLYRGTEDWARLWQANEASQEFGEIVARVITYEPATGRVEVVDQQAITVSPKPRPGTGAAPKPGSKALLKP